MVKRKGEKKANDDERVSAVWFVYKSAASIRKYKITVHVVVHTV